MLRAILTTFQNQKSKIVLWCLVALSILLFARIVIKSIWTYKNIIATTSTTKSANALLQTVIESYNSSHSISKLKLHEISTFDKSANLHSGENIDFAVIAPGTPIPNGFEVIASLNEEKIVLVSHKGNHFEQLRDVGNATINIVNINDYDEGVLRKLFDFFETTEQRNKINVISLDNFLASKILPNRIVYAFFLNSFSSTSHKIFKTSIQKLRDKLDVTEIDLAALADSSYLFFSSAIKKGELSIHPLLPREDIDTVSAFTYLVARTTVSEEVISRILTFLNASKKLIHDKVSRDAFLNVEGISESKNIAFHRGYKKFLNGENEGFFQKNSDTIYILGVALAAVFSFVYSNYKKRKRKADESHIGILEVFEGLEKDWYEDLPSEDKQRILKVKKVLTDLIIHRSNKKNVLMNSMIGFLVLTNVTNALRKRDDAYKDS
jgi:TRAP-type uncharacterized transport system substrate-binding protein